MTDKIKFEDALKKLENIVEQLEDGELSLEESLAIFEEGIKLSRLCSKQLDDIERKIEILIKGKDGEFEIVSFDEELEDDEDSE
ncbi:TPA: exodeoxyribonuclease VII small subunit [bacterium]|nr:exodeoxyribonuclease VII small subunit [bacterium]